MNHHCVADTALNLVWWSTSTWIEPLWASRCGLYSFGHKVLTRKMWKGYQAVLQPSDVSLSIASELIEGQLIQLNAIMRFLQFRSCTIEPFLSFNRSISTLFSRLPKLLSIEIRLKISRRRNSPKTKYSDISRRVLTLFTRIAKNAPRSYIRPIIVNSSIFHLLSVSHHVG